MYLVRKNCTRRNTQQRRFQVKTQGVSCTCLPTVTLVQTPLSYRMRNSPRVVHMLEDGEDEAHSVLRLFEHKIRVLT